MKELFYFLFLISGMLKAFLIYFNTYLPLTIILASLLIIILCFDLYKNNFYFKSKYQQGILSMLLLFLWILISTLYTTSEIYFIEKLLMLFLVFLSFLFPLIIKKFSLKNFYWWSVLVTIILTLVYIPLFFISYTHYLTTTEANSIYSSYLIMGYIISVAIIISSFTNTFSSFIIKISIIAILTVGLIVTGARGPLIFLILSILIFLLFKIFQGNYKVTKNSIKYTIATLCFTSLLVLPLLNKIDITTFVERTMSRLTSLENISSDSSAGDRLIQAKYTIDSLNPKNFIIGHGFGSYGYERAKLDQRLYPHNILLEILFEIGIIGIFIFSYFIFIIVRRISTGMHFILFLFLFLNSLKSLSLVDSRLMFGIFSLILLSSINTKIRRKLS